MERRDFFRKASLRALALWAVIVGVGCSRILGIEEWDDSLPFSGAGSAGDSDDGGLPSTCSNGVQDGLTETDIDCGGGTCGPCALSKKCKLNADCETKRCGPDKVCVNPPPTPCDGHAGGGGAGGADGQSPSCTDCVLSTGETDVDCGGDACSPCGAKMACLIDNDCLSQSCVGGHCSIGTAGDPCRANVDCTAGTCESGACWTGYCCP